jgi:hypothetical protein
VVKGFLQGSCLTEPDPFTGLDRTRFGVRGHLLETGPMGGFDAQETTACAGVFVDTGGSVRAAAVARSNLAKEEVLLELVPLLPARRPRFTLGAQGAPASDEVLVSPRATR